MTKLLRPAEAAAMLGVPERGLVRAADQHGLLVRIGRAVRIDADTLPELIEKCRSAPKAPVSTGTTPAGNGSSVTPDDPRLQRAQQTVQLLKRR